ncbi:MAG: hypothetical protein CM15mP77_1800 [Synechococcus sp.]|nr:MAG: hypothetical protein CM15mP77_1800 [Synechococcus sp.]
MIGDRSVHRCLVRNRLGLYTVLVRPIALRTDSPVAMTGSTVERRLAGWMGPHGMTLWVVKLGRVCCEVILRQRSRASLRALQLPSRGAIALFW